MPLALTSARPFNRTLSGCDRACCEAIDRQSGSRPGSAVPEEPCAATHRVAARAAEDDGAKELYAALFEGESDEDRGAP
jgi:hypothetical protein